MSKPSFYPQFTGTVPQNYDDYLGPMIIEPFASEIATRIHHAHVNQVLELGCGTGRVTAHLRKALPESAMLIASDISQEMLTIARNKLGSGNIKWSIIDAQELPFADNSMDLIVCYFGYMFVPDRKKAFAQAFRVLRPGGMLVFSTWDKLEYNEKSHIFREAVKKYLGDNVPESYKLPFSMFDTTLIKALLRNAGFSTIAIEKADKQSTAASARLAAEGLVYGSLLYNEIIQQDPALVSKIISSVEVELKEKYGDHQIVTPMRAIITQARK